MTDTMLFILYIALGLIGLALMVDSLFYARHYAKRQRNRCSRCGTRYFSEASTRCIVCGNEREKKS